MEEQISYVDDTSLDISHSDKSIKENIDVAVGDFIIGRVHGVTKATVRNCIAEIMEGINEEYVV